MKKPILYDYLDKVQFALKYMPIDLYFLHERLSNEKTEDLDENKINVSNFEIIPNILKKYDYSGNNIAVPTGPLSQIFNHKKIIKIENSSK